MPDLPFPTLISPMVVTAENAGEAANIAVIAIHMGLTFSYAPKEATFEHVVIINIPIERMGEFKAKLEAIS